MGYPTRSLREILKHKENILRNYPNCSYAFILYKNEHKSFKNFILENFNMFDQNSPDVLFFLLDYPKTWFDQQRRQDHLELRGKQYTYNLNDSEVDKVLEHFNIKNFQLPLVITFKDLASYKTSVFSLKKIQNQNFELMRFFTTLYKPLRNGETYYTRSQSIHRDFTNVTSKVMENPNRDRVYVIFEKIIEVIELINDDVIRDVPELATFRAMLESTLDSFLESKQTFKKKIKELENALQMNGSLETENEIEQLHHLADNKLYEFQQTINVGKETLEELLGKKQLFTRLFENESVSMIHSSLLTEKVMSQIEIQSYDYSIFAVGYWKALEIELNIVVADAIRMLHNYINSIPSRGRSNKRNQLIVHGKRRNDITKININEYRSNQRKDLMFGQLIQLMDYAEGNRYEEILKAVTKHIKNLGQQQEFRLELISDLKEIVYDYRNKASHTSQLSYEELQKAKDILFGKNGLYHRIAKIKGTLLKEDVFNQLNDTKID